MTELQLEHWPSLEGKESLSPDEVDFVKDLNQALDQNFKNLWEGNRFQWMNDNRFENKWNTSDSADVVALKSLWLIDQYGNFNKESLANLNVNGNSTEEQNMGGLTDMRKDAKRNLYNIANKVNYLYISNSWIIKSEVQNDQISLGDMRADDILQYMKNYYKVDSVIVGQTTIQIGGKVGGMDGGKITINVWKWSSFGVFRERLGQAAHQNGLDKVSWFDSKKVTEIGGTRFKGPAPSDSQAGTSDYLTWFDKRGGILENLPSLGGELFDTASANFTAEARAKLESIYTPANIALMQEELASGKALYISGHTDNEWAATGNITLSDGRANALKNYLIGKWLDGSKIMVKGFGETQPIQPNTTPDNKAINRRVEAWFQKPSWRDGLVASVDS